MNNEQKMVKEFHKLFGILINESPTEMDEETKELRIRLIREEVCEWEEAADEKGLAEIASELVDILYVVYGTGVSLGIDLESVFTEVHNANMRKIGGHKRDGKFIKPDGFIPADIESVIKKQTMKSNRPSWDEYFSIITKDVSLRSTCLRHKFGCTIVKDTEIIATGYNGATKNSEHCLDIGCLRNDNKIPSGENIETCRGVHAEQNALLQAGKEAKGSTLYVNGHPCKVCSKLMINAGIKRVVISGDYADKEGAEMLKKSGVEVAR